MAAVPKVLARATLNATSEATVSVPTAKQWAVTNIVIANSHATVTTKVTVKLDGVVLVPGVTLAPGVLFTLDCAQVMDAGKVLGVQCSVASTIGLHVSGVESDVV